MITKENRNNLIWIGGLAKKAGLPRSTVKYYVEQKLLLPKRTTKAGYRLFDEREGLKCLAKTRKLQEVRRWTIREIKEHFKTVR